jgi:hypothetical protein
MRPEAGASAWIFCFIYWLVVESILAFLLFVEWAPLFYLAALPIVLVVPYFLLRATPAFYFWLSSASLALMLALRHFLLHAFQVASAPGGMGS